MHVSPGRFSDKTEEESKLYSIDWTNGIGTNTIDANGSAPVWRSEPAGLTFADAIVNGKVTQARIGGGARGQSYRVRCRITLVETGEVIEASTNDQPGVPLQVLGPAPARSGYLPGTVYGY